MEIGRKWRCGDQWPGVAGVIGKTIGVSGGVMKRYKVHPRIVSIGLGTGIGIRK